MYCKKNYYCNSDKIIVVINLQKSNFDKVLWKDMVGLADSEFEVYTLEEWRNSS